MSKMVELNNIYMIDSKMFGFEKYSSIYLLKGRKNALIDTGLPTQLETVRKGIKMHNLSIKDISYIFVTHCEHPDHSGNVGSLVKENPNVEVYIHPKGLEYLTNPEIEAAQRKKILPSEMASRFGEMVPVQPSNIKLLSNGEVFNIGNEIELEVIFAPGHQPSGIVLFEKKNGGLFINDLVGNCFLDADFLMSLTPYRSDIREVLKSLEKLEKLSPSVLFLGHFGICHTPKEIIQRAKDDIHELLDIGNKCLKEGKPEEISKRVVANRMTKLEKLKAIRGEEQYNYLKNELIPSLATAFAEYMKRTGK